MRRRALIVLLALGTVGGFGSGLMHTRRCRAEAWRAHHERGDDRPERFGRGEARRERFDRQVADVCARAAREAAAEGAGR
ncbi:MAG TPA: hypothetical protein VFS43_02835 [Polyangiaceae bacterium]|nr:hypothetical protein [Polyangiaceae bacterium]